MWPKFVERRRLRISRPYAFQSHPDLLQIPDIDLVVVPVKVSQHFDSVSTALKAGKSVCCEWPLGRNLAEAVKLARQKSQSTWRRWTSVSGYTGYELCQRPDQ